MRRLSFREDGGHLTVMTATPSGDVRGIASNYSAKDDGAAKKGCNQIDFYDLNPVIVRN